MRFPVVYLFFVGRRSIRQRRCAGCRDMFVQRRCRDFQPLRHLCDGDAWVFQQSRGGLQFLWFQRRRTATKAATFAGCSQARHRPFADQAALEFSDAVENVMDQLSRDARRGIAQGGQDDALDDPAPPRLGEHENKLYFAFRELGRTIRTLFLLKYLNDPEVRRTIHTANRTILEIALESANGRDGGIACRNIVLCDDGGRSRLRYASKARPTSRDSGRSRSRRVLAPRI